MAIIDRIRLHNKEKELEDFRRKALDGLVGRSSN